ncbi:MAG: ethanolamine ammonia-lyase reactivating factor EutA, partial [Firmicutes bacterium]|nr:ethanolamine ammonia-lyase reactivating factor EutA [Bacillota bacterium]
MTAPGHARPHSHTHGAGHAHAHGPADAHDHWHAHAAGDALRLWSVGIDVGSSTTHMTVSQLLVGHPNSVVHRKPEVLERRLVYRSPIAFTP